MVVNFVEPDIGRTKANFPERRSKLFLRKNFECLARLPHVDHAETILSLRYPVK